MRFDGRQKWNLRRVLNHRVDDQEQQIATEGGPSLRERSFQSAAGHLVKWFTMEFERTGRSIAIFTAGTNDFR